MRNKTSEINRMITNAKKFVDVRNFIGGVNELLNSLHGIAGAFNNIYFLLVHVSNLIVSDETQNSGVLNSGMNCKILSSSHL